MKKLYYKFNGLPNCLGVAVEMDEDTVYSIMLAMYGIKEKKSRLQEKLYRAMGEYYRCDLEVKISDVMIFSVCPELITALKEIDDTKPNDVNAAIEILKKYRFEELDEEE